MNVIAKCFLSKNHIVFFMFFISRNPMKRPTKTNKSSTPFVETDVNPMPLTNSPSEWFTNFQMNIEIRIKFALCPCNKKHVWREFVGPDDGPITNMFFDNLLNGCACFVCDGDNQSAVSPISWFGRDVDFKQKPMTMVVCPALVRHRNTLCCVFAWWCAASR